MRLAFILLFYSSFFIGTQAQSVSGAGRVIDMKNYWSATKGYTSSLGIDLNSEVNKIYLSTKNGPYYKNRWFKGVVNTIAGDRIEDNSVEYRFDRYLHSLHFRRVGDDDIQVMPSETYKGFVLEDESKTEFVKLLPPLSPLYPEAKYYELLSNNTGGKLVKLYYAQLESYQVAGPSNDGRTKNRFKNITALFIEKSSGNFVEIKPKKKSILSILPQYEKNLLAFEKENGKIKTEERLIQFLNIL